METTPECGDANLLGAILEVAAQQPDKAWIEADVDKAEGADGRILYGALDDLTGRLAAILAVSGVGIGDRVAAQLEKSPLNILLYLACLRAGAVYLPLNTAYTDAELDFFIRDAEPRLIVCDPLRRPGIERLKAARNVTIHTLDGEGRGSLKDALDRQQDGMPLVACGPDDLAAICYTSGTTGRSKGAMLTHGNLSSNARTLQSLWGFAGSDRLIHALPVYHVHGLFVATNTITLAGAAMLFLPRFDVDRVIALLPHATSMMGVPTFYTRLLAHPGLTREAARHMRLFISGSAPLLDETFHAFEQRTSHRILERYGMTETGMNCSNPLDGARKPGTVGPPLPDVQARIRGESGELLKTGGVGTLEVKGANVFKGYWRMPEKTREEFTEDGFFKTGDIATIDEDGYVAIVGRAKDLIISGGLNVYPKEVESILDDLPGIGESAVIGVAHPDLGEAVVAVVTRDDSLLPLDEANIIQQARTRLAGFKAPKRILVTDSLPRNSMGKVQKSLLRERHQELFGN